MMFIFLLLDNELEFFHLVKLVIPLITINSLINNNIEGFSFVLSKEAAFQA